MNKTINIVIGTFISLIVSALVFSLVFASLVNTIEKHEMAYSFDRMTGRVTVYTNSSWHVLMPIRYEFHKIDLRPVQLTLNANSRVLNAKLVSFNPKGVGTFILWHGMSAGDNSYELQEILKSYAFDKENGKDCPFLNIENEVAPSQSYGTNTERSVEIIYAP